jgi:hypothetical protein
MKATVSNEEAGCKLLVGFSKLELTLLKEKNVLRNPRSINPSPTFLPAATQSNKR